MSGKKVEKIYPLSNMQKGMLYHSIKGTSSNAYFEQIVMDIKGSINEAFLEESFHEIIKRHEILRASFNYKMNEPLHVILKDRKMKFNYMDISAVDLNDKQPYIENYLKEDRSKGFDITKDTLMRVCLIKTEESFYKLVWSFHHILLDGWCIGIILDELFTIYSHKLKGTKHQLDDPKPYSDYIKWLNSQDTEEGLVYWDDYLKGYDVKTTIPRLSNENGRDYKRGERIIEFTEEMTEKIVRLATKNHVTLNTVVQSIWGLILAKYNNTEDAVFGTVVSGRDALVDGIENMVGLFINTIPTRITFDSDYTFQQLLKSVQEGALDTNNYNFISLADIQSQSTLNHHLLDHVLVFENYAVDKEAIEDKESDLGFEIVSVTDEERSNYDFSITVGIGKKLKLMLVYDESVYERELINNIAVHIENVTLQVSENDTRKIGEIDLLSDTEKQILFNKLNQTKQLYPKHKLLHQLFEEQAEKTPDRVAVHCGDKSLTYMELNQRSNQIAQMLREKGIQNNNIIALISDRSFEMVIGIVGILKSGATYLPIDPDTPRDRVKYMLKDSNASMLLTKDLFMDKARFGIEAISLDKLDLSKYSSENLPALNNSQDVAYIVYTSGSTGTPKGVMIPHYSAIRVVKNTNYIEIFETDSILQLSNYSFDGSIFDIFGALLNGARLVMIDKEAVLDINKLSQVIKNNHISVMFITTALFNTLVDLEIDCLDNVRKILFGGERVSVSHVRKALEKLGKDKLIHVYGPTESTVFSTYYFINEETEIIPIGKPIANTSVFVVGRGNQLLPAGVPGELCISGDGLSTGYLNNTNLTAEKFVPNPFVPEEKMYRTGDLVRMLPDGNIEFLDRIDNQVKLRGYRIELGEIENQLLKCNEVNEAVVNINRDQDEQQYICAYFTSSNSKSDLVKELRAFLEQSLPYYMIPSFFVQMDNLPLTKNGKVNRAALPQPDETNFLESYEAPTNDVEEKVLSIWKDILGVEKISINQSFFEVGGHSLKATTMISRIHKEFKIEVPLRQIFQTPTIKGIGEFIILAKEGVYSSIKPIEEKAFYPLSSAQKRLFILNQIEGTGISYNMPFAMKINGDLNIKQLEKSFCKLIERHESLRTSFSMEDGEPIQKIHKRVEFHLSYRKVDSEEVDRIVSEFVKFFDLESAPLLRAGLLTLSDDEHLLMLDMHHIISDGVSMGILMHDLAHFYEEKELKPISLQYKDYSAWQKELYAKEELKKQEAYWTNVFKDEIPVLNLPTDFKRPLKQSIEGSQHSFEITSTLREKLNQIAKENGVTIYMLLLASYTALLSKYTNQDDIVVGSPIAGRPHHDLKHIVGLFVNTLAMRNFPKGQKTFVQYLKEVKENALKAYENQDYPFDELVEKLDINRDMSRSALFDTMFVLQNLEFADDHFKNLKFETFETKTKIAKFDLTLSAIETDDTIKFDLEYCTALFKQETAERISNHFVSVLREISNNPEVPLNQIDILTDDERHLLLGQFNQTETVYPKDKTIQQLFMEQADRTPERTAVVCGHETLTYRELNERSNQIARLLLQKGVQPETIVGIMADRSPEMIAGMIGIIKAGAAYLPIDPDYPEERLQYLMKDSGTKLLLTQEHLIEKIPFTDTMGISVIALDDERIAKAEKTNVTVRNKPSDLAYVIYTSGSTGKPKGVLVEHKSLMNLCHWYVNFHEIRESDRITNYLKYSFDASITEIFPCLITGAELHVLRGDIRLDMGKLNEYMNENGITVATLPYKVGEQFMQQDNHSLRMLISGGEQLNMQTDTEYQLVNAYGPTENTCVTTSYFADRKGQN
ncbi:amino acid adenylation domain-containing protein, partial [Bacillus velezensis]|uniref:amino acid adenylation domain-containing protein n=3 Tax=Bacillus velezensis TaxID=492670 RepID=UPI00313709D7